MSYLSDLNLRLCATSVFREALKKPIFNIFSRFCEAQSTNDKISAYAEFVQEIYLNGGSLSDYILRLILEDENVYIKSMAHGIACDENINTAKEHELSVFSEFARLTKDKFVFELNTEYLPNFKSERLDFSKLYAERIQNISKYGYGIFSSHPMFRLADNGEIEAIITVDKTGTDKFIGYEYERGMVVSNTKAFIEGRSAANALLCGDAGTGKSSTVKAVVNDFYRDGLRLIELRKDQLSSLPYVMGKISGNPLKFIIFIDDLSFNRSDDNFSMLKAALEGSASCKAENAIIYATSNRRHIIKENFSDRDGNDVHRNDTLQETLSLSERFGLVVLFSKPDKKLYLDIVHELAERANIDINRDELDIKAEAFALRRGNRSARCAEQFIDSLK